MGVYRKILVAVDGSDSSKNALRQACRIARADKSWVTVITTVPLYQDQFEVLSVKEKAVRVLRAEGRRVLSEMEKIAREEEVHVKTMLEEGSPFSTITDMAGKDGYSLIVMGRLGKTHLEKALMGSVTARVIGHTDKDVLVAPAKTSIGWDRVLVATDGSRHGSAAACRAVNLARQGGGRLIAISVVDVTEEFQARAPDVVEKLVKKSKSVLDEVRKKGEAAGLKVDTRVKEGEAYDAITRLAKEVDANIIVMGSHGRTGLMRMFMGSVTEKVIGHAPCPVLVVRSGA